MIGFVSPTGSTPVYIYILNNLETNITAEYHKTIEPINNVAFSEANLNIEKLL